MRDILDIKLLSQSFEASPDADLKLDNGKLIAEMYSRLENCISVLSDMRSRRSYIYYGAIAQQIGLSTEQAEIGSIWEDELLNRVNAEDLQKKYRLELQFFQLLNSIGPAERTNYQAITKLRIRNVEGKYMLIKHRLLYIGSSDDGSIRFALCLYNMIYDHPEYEVPQSVIINTSSGKTIDYNHNSFTDMLSAREKEVLRLIKHGRRSKEIADKLSLSINTVNRHRQNIFQKLNVTNAMEACKVAETTGLL
ncbi:response regulator transcription factor [Pedobacter metabolipauper]|uniref:Regulatory LuxR family protein n=1 Tax=Pedobacter metabolipauper TaxID=425513 RepID=A0A4R6SPT2_9SPHI|nr:LuxR C-terminal-related transcriptional regulator [Pedobacter metabolipauper]TDQ06619.1 regulatory LuxR family protein [Pedobacter metabolipauper]